MGRRGRVGVAALPGTLEHTQARSWQLLQLLADLNVSKTTQKFTEFAGAPP